MELFFTMLVPLIIAAVALYGMARRVDVYDALVQGAGEGPVSYTHLTLPTILLV